MDEGSARRAAHLIETGELAGRIEAGDSSIRIVDMRGTVRTQALSEGVQAAAKSLRVESVKNGGRTKMLAKGPFTESIQTDLVSV